MVFQIGYITIDGKEYPVLATSQGLYRITEELKTEKIYVDMSRIHKEKEMK